MSAARILSPAARLAADCRAESAELVAAGRRPKSRMAAPSVPNTGEPLFVTSDSKGNLSSQGSMPGKLDGRALLDLLPAQAVVFIDRVAARLRSAPLSAPVWRAPLGSPRPSGT